jgi:hypothetical protein
MYSTVNIDEAVYLRAIGKPLIGTDWQGRFVQFSFDATPAEAAQLHAGASVNAQDLLTAYRAIRTVVANKNREVQARVYSR